MISLLSHIVHFPRLFDRKIMIAPLSSVVHPLDAPISPPPDPAEAPLYFVTVSRLGEVCEIFTDVTHIVMQCKHGEEIR